MAGALTLAAACRPPRSGGALVPVGPPLTYSSEGSEYTPVLRVGARVWVGRDSVVVTVDSGFVLAPGARAPGLPAVMRALRLTAVLAAPRPPGSPEVGAPGAAPGGTAWVRLGESAPGPLADSLQVGVPHPVGPGRLAVTRPPGLVLGRSFVVLRVSGDAVEIGAARGGGARVGRVLRNAVRVYACAAAPLDGRPDAARAAALAANYIAAC